MHTKILSITVFFLLTYSTAYSSSSKTATTCKCLPHQDCWLEIDWNDLSNSLGDPTYLETFKHDRNCKDEMFGLCDHEITWSIDDPYSWQTKSWAHLTMGRIGAFKTKPSLYTVAARSSQDVSEAIKFAQKNHLKLVVKSGAHDYLGRSQDPNALLIWTHHMRDIKFNPKHEICGETFQTVSVGGGARWQEVHNALEMTDRTIIGGAVGSVGVAGYTLGGGYGLMARKFGPTAGYVREIELVQPDGKIVTLNACHGNQDLFHALKGSGNAAYGVVTKFVFETIAPYDIGIVNFEIESKSDQGFKFLIQNWLNFYMKELNNENFGNTITMSRKKEGGGKIYTDALFYTGISKENVQSKFFHLERSLSHPTRHEIHFDVNFFEPFSIKLFRSKSFNEMFIPGTKSSSTDPNFFYKPHEGSPTLWNIASFESLFLDKTKFDDLNRLTEVMFKATGHHAVTLQMSKAMNHASEEAIKRTNMSSVHKGTLDTPIFISIADGGIGHSLSRKELERQQKQVKLAFNEFLKLYPNRDFGSYSNQSSYDIDHWQSALFGKKEYQKLLTLKKTLDPNGLFTCHHCVGNELWDQNGCSTSVDSL